MSEGYSENDYHRWLRINAFVRRMHQENYMYQLAEELDRLDEIDVIVDCMDEYPEVEELLDRVWNKK
mgnify:CR=1 FL=1|tara:strand:- start:1859 stop:2059 length:201 start_codon:yes stop_codon:yes gene_type:complete